MLATYHNAVYSANDISYYVAQMTNSLLAVQVQNMRLATTTLTAKQSEPGWSK